MIGDNEKYLGNYSFEVLPSCIRINNLGLDTRIVNRLKHYEIFTLEKLLDFDYDKLVRIRGFGEDSILKIKECVHKYGYVLKNEKLTLGETKKVYRSEGKVLLEDLGLDCVLCAILYKNNIYTLEEIMQYGEDIYNLKKIGVNHKYKLKFFLQENNCVFPKKEYPLGHIETFNFSTRVKKILYRQGIDNVYQLEKCSYQYFKKIRNLGEKGLNEILEVMHSVGVKFHDEDMLNESVKSVKEIKEEKVYTIRDVRQDKINIDEHEVEILKNQIQMLEYLKKEKEKLIKEYQNLLEKQNELLEESSLLEQQLSSLGGVKNELSRKRNK